MLTLKKISKMGVPLFFILPWVGFCSVLFNLRAKRSAVIFVLFAALFGFAISFSDTSADSYRYALAFKRFDNTLDYNRILTMYRSGELRDVYRLVIFYVSSMFSSNPKVMYALAGFVYGIFCYSSLRIFVNEKGTKWNKSIFILGLVFFTFVSLANINGFRFNTGALVFFLSVYNSIILNKKGWIIGILITPLFHYGFIPIVPVILLYKIFGNLFLSKETIKPILFYGFSFSFIISWFLSTNAIDISFLSQSNLIDGAVGSRLNYITSDDVTSLVNSRSENSLFLGVQKYFNIAIKIYIFISVWFLWRLQKKRKIENNVFKKLFTFVLFFYSFSFIATSFPSGARFLNIAHLFFIILLLKFYISYQSAAFKKMIGWLLPVFSFNIAFTNILLPILILTPKFWYGNVFWIIIDGLSYY